MLLYHQKLSCFIVVFTLMVGGYYQNAFAEYSSKVYLRYALKMLKVQKASDAHAILNKGIKKYPQAVELYYLRAKVRADSLQNYISAFQDYSIVIKFSGNKYPKAYWRRGDIYASQGRFKYAIKDYSACLKLKPNYGKVYLKRGKAYLKIGKWNSAKKDLQYCKKFSPAYTAVANKLLKQYYLK